MTQRIALGVSLGNRWDTVEWDDQERPPTTFVRGGRIYEVVMTASVEHVDIQTAWPAALGSRRAGHTGAGAR